MKNKNFQSITMYFALGLLLIGLVQCSKDEEETPPSAPTITVLSPAEENPSAYPGQLMQLSLEIKSDAANGANLKSLQIIQQFETDDAIIKVNESITTGSSYSRLLELIVSLEEGTETWTITVTDDAGNTKVKVITVTISGDTPDLSPTLLFAGGIHQGSGLPYENVNFTIEINQEFAMGIIATSNQESGGKLEKFTLKKKAGTTNPETIFETEFSADQFDWDSTFFASYQTTVETYFFRITDEYGQFIEKSIIATVEQTNTGILTFTGVQLGSWESGMDAGFSTATGETYNIPQVPTEDENKVHIVFGNTDAYGYTLFAPASPLVWQPYPAINSWTTQTDTKFAKAVDLTVEQFNQIENLNSLTLMIQNFSGISGFTQTHFSEVLSNPGGFDVNDIIGFENPSGDRGLMLIKAKDDGASSGFSSFIFDMKVVAP